MPKQFVISPDLIGPWDALLSLLQSKSEGLRVPVRNAKQQAMNLNNLLEELQLLDPAAQIAALEARIAALEAAASAAPSAFVPFEETPFGTQNGSNPIFSLSVTPVLLRLTLNGQLLEPAGNDYTQAGNMLIYTTGKIPEATDLHYASGWRLP